MSWSTVRILLCLTLSQEWVTKQLDFSNIFIQTTSKENVYVSLPEGFDLEGRKKSPNFYALKLNNSLYGLVQSPILVSVLERQSREIRAETDIKPF